MEWSSRLLKKSLRVIARNEASSRERSVAGRSDLINRAVITMRLPLAMTACAAA